MQGNKQKSGVGTGKVLKSVKPVRIHPQSVQCQVPRYIQTYSLQKMYKPVGEDDVCLIKSTEKGILRGSYIL